MAETTRAPSSSSSSSLSSSSSRSKSETHKETGRVLSDSEIARINRYWQAANFLSVGQIYLQENVLLKEPLKREHIKPRLLGHFGTAPGLNLLYVHMNRCIKERDLNVLFVTGPGHGGPAIVANVYLEGTYTEVYPKVTHDEHGIRQLCRQFSTPGGIPSHVSPPTPGSIHEGGELGYVLTHAFGACFDNRDLLALAVVGDGEAETGPLEGSWKSIKFLNPLRDGAVLPVLHLNGYKISGPTVLARQTNENIQSLLHGHGYDVYFVEGDEPINVHKQLAKTLDICLDKIHRIQSEARENPSKYQASYKHDFEAPRWPVIVMRTPKGWTGPVEVDGKPVENTFRSHQVPLSNVRESNEHLKMLEKWLKSYHPEQLFDENGRLLQELQDLHPIGDKRMGALKHANGGLLTQPLDIPDVREYTLTIKAPASERICSTHQLGLMIRDIYRRNPSNFRFFCPDETNSNRFGAVFEASDRCFVSKTIDIDEKVSPDGRVMEVLSEHLCEGWLEGYTLTGRHGLFVSYEAFGMIVASMVTQHGKWLETSLDLEWRAPVPSLNILLSSTAYRNDHNGFSHQGPGFMDVVLSRRSSVARIFVPPDANCLLALSDHVFRSFNKINLIIIDKQPQLQYLSIEEAVVHAREGASIWKWASNVKDDESDPDIIIASAGDIPTQEALAATHFLRMKAPQFKVRFVNVIDLLSLYASEFHPNGMPPAKFANLFTNDVDVVFAFHGYPHALHALLHRRPKASRFHVRGFLENGTTTTPFDMVVLNKLDRYSLVKEALIRTKNPPLNIAELISECDAMLRKHEQYSRQMFEDLPEITNWKWTD